MSTLTLRQLEVFDAVVAAGGSVTEAATALFVSQPSVSDTLSTLQRTLGAPLFEGRGRARALTPAGLILAEHARRVFDELRAARQSIADLADEVRGGLTVLAVPTAAESFVPIALRTCRRLHPGVDLTLQVANRSAALDVLESGSADVIVMGRPPPATPTNRRLMPNRLIPVRAADHPPVVSPRGAPVVAALLVRERGSGTSLTVGQALDDHGLRFQSVMAMGSNAAVVAGVRAGLGVAVVPEITVTGELERGELVEFELPGFPLERAWYALWPASRPLSRPALALLDILEGLDPPV